MPRSPDCSAKSSGTDDPLTGGTPKIDNESAWNDLGPPTGGPATCNHVKKG